MERSKQACPAKFHIITLRESMEAKWSGSQRSGRAWVTHQGKEEMRNSGGRKTYSKRQHSKHAEALLAQPHRAQRPRQEEDATAIIKPTISLRRRDQTNVRETVVAESHSKSTRPYARKKKKTQTHTPPEEGNSDTHDGSQSKKVSGWERGGPFIRSTSSARRETHSGDFNINGCGKTRAPPRKKTKKNKKNSQSK